MKILIADDNNADRLILKKILTKADHEVFAAVDGVEAVELFNQCNPDLILLDALMPNMDGYEAAIEIKKASGDNLIPIIFLTSLKEASALARCLEVGGDDFLTKPYNQVILQAKLKAFERMKLLYDQVIEQRNKINEYNEHMLHEQEVAKRVFDNIAHTGNLNQKNINHLLSPMSVFNGDLLLSAKAPSGNSHIMLGDFTGHGLAAAIGAMPVAEIFYGMTVKGFSIADIISEINTRLSTILPVGVFCCATACEINYRDESLTVWSGGLPDGYLIRPEKGIVEIIKSTHLPLGVLNKASFSVETMVFRFKDGDKLYIFSDGILEAEAPDGSMFGEDRVLELISDGSKVNNLFQSLLESVAKFTHTEAQSDDLTLLEYVFDSTVDNEGDVDNTLSKPEIKSLDWAMSYEFRPETLRTLDPLPLVLQILMECPRLSSYRSRVFTILAELYSNALEHGVLGLDSQLKKSATGFAEYYTQRKEKLDRLETGFVKIKMENIPNPSGGELTIEVEDSGRGFDHIKKHESDNNLSGRGLSLVKTLCSDIQHFDNGRIIKVVFNWTNE